jgi:hypothetical protein
MGWWKKRADAESAKEMQKLRTERNDACAQRDAAESERHRTQQNLTRMTELAGEMAGKSLALERELGLMKTQLRTVMSLLDAVRTVPELVIDIANEGRTERVVYERAERGGVAREVECVNQVHAILVALKSSRTLFDARERVLLGHIEKLKTSASGVQERVEMAGEREEDTRKVYLDGREET